MKPNFLYLAFFIDRTSFHDTISSIGTRLTQKIEAPHVTCFYKNAQAEQETKHLFGRKVKFEAYGYGNDGINEGFLVRPLTTDKELLSLFDGIAIPHITASLSNEGKAVNTAKLNFIPIEPFTFVGTYGGMNHHQYAKLTP